VEWDKGLRPFHTLTYSSREITSSTFDDAHGKTEY
jgi:hypothetical protein